MKNRERNELVLKGLGIYKMFVKDFRYTIHYRYIEQEEYRNRFNTVMSSGSYTSLIDKGIIWSGGTTGVVWCDVFNTFADILRTENIDRDISEFKCMYKQKYGKTWTYEKET